MIEKHISALLYRYQCVTVPGFGAFLAEFRPASLDAATHTFYPPKKQISFNANVKNNDGLLANHIATQEKISYDQAVTAIAEAVARWQSITRSGILELKNLGSFSENTEGSLVFKPDVPVNYLTDAFGLSTVVSPSVKREELKAIAEAIEEKAPVIFTPERKRSYSYLKYAAIFVVLAGAGTGGFAVVRDRQVAAETLLVEQAVQEKVQNRIQQATFFIDNPIPAVTLPVKEAAPEKMPYHVVAGAFKSPANADKAVRQLQAKGFSARRLDANKFGLYPVLYGSYKTHAEAEESMRHIRKTENTEAWVLIKDL